MTGNLAATDGFGTEMSSGKKSSNMIELEESSIGDNQSVNKRSAIVAASNVINRKQQRTNMIGTGLDLNPYNRKQLMKMVRYIAKHGGLRRGFRTKRTVESPARSTDTGGRPSQKGITGNIAKLFSSKLGHYSDIYDDIDFKKPINTTQFPTEPADTLVRIDAIQRV